MTTMTVDPVQRRDALAGRMAAAALGAYDLCAVYLGDRLGLYAALAEGGPATAPELAVRAGIDPRYAREWLEHQAVGGFLDVAAEAEDPDLRRYVMPAGHAEVLLDPDSLTYLAPLARFMVGGAQRMPDLLTVYRTGAGIDWANYGPDVFEAQASMNRPQFDQLIGDWVGALPDIAARLAGGAARVADIGCGTGWSSIAIARHFPAVRVDGIDVDAVSIEQARRHAAEAGLTERVRFQLADAGGNDERGRYDLVTIFEALHDMARPVQVLSAARSLLAPGGAVLIADERVAERFTAPGDDAERLFYGYSIMFCLPNGLADTPSVGTGTVLRPSAVETMAAEAGFGRFTILPVEHDSFRFYRLDP
jgi:SAM-dependent methyltransferase